MNSIEALDYAIELVRKEYRLRQNRYAAIPVFEAERYERAKALFTQADQAWDTLSALREHIASQQVAAGWQQVRDTENR
jgi:hypothetical protein